MFQSYFCILCQQIIPGGDWVTANPGQMFGRNRGVGLLFALALGVVLVGLASVVALMTRQRVAQLQRTQWAVQARLNAHSGLSRFCATHQVPAAAMDFGPTGSCEIQQKGQDLWFVGRCHGLTRSLLAPMGDVRRIREVSP